ncbi:unnamed protein product [Ectocarpus sp. 12 AP-2014]
MLNYDAFVRLMELHGRRAEAAGIADAPPRPRPSPPWLAAKMTGAGGGGDGGGSAAWNHHSGKDHVELFTIENEYPHLRRRLNLRLSGSPGSDTGRGAAGGFQHIPSCSGVSTMASSINSNIRISSSIGGSGSGLEFP